MISWRGETESTGKGKEIESIVSTVLSGFRPSQAMIGKHGTCVTSLVGPEA